MSIFKIKFIFRTENLYLHNRMHISIKIPQKGRKKNFSQELQKDKNFLTLSPAIHLEGWVNILNMNT